MSPEGNSHSLSRRCDAIDKLVSIDLPQRGVIGMLYDAARSEAGEPLSLRAARILHENLSPGRVALIATGWLDRPHVSLTIAESDGPPGAAALARAVHAGCGAIPFILVEQQIVDATIAVVQAAGLRCVAPDEALLAAGGSGALHCASVIALPQDRQATEAAAQDLLNRFDVGVFVAVEKGGENGKGRIRTSRGADTTDALAKADALREACTARGIPTIGIGDGGNEIGMGRIRDLVAPRLRNALDASGSPEDGTMPAGKTDALVAATVSNWGANGVATALALLLGRPEVMHTAEIEEAILRASAAAGFIDGVSGWVGPTSDGMPLSVNLALVRLLRTILGDGLDTSNWKSDGDSPRPATLPDWLAAATTRWDLQGGQDRARRAADAIDQLLSIDLPERDVIDIAFAAFRQHYRAPLSWLAAKALSGVKPGQLVLIGTGFPNRPRIDPDIAESDGPLGAAALARAVHMGLGAVPVILIERPLIPAMQRILQVMGLRAETLDAAKRAATPSRQYGACVLAIPTDWAEAEAQAALLMADEDVGALVVIEKGALNLNGDICFSRGRVNTPHVGKIDPIVTACRKHGVPTIGIGDGGNEMGMGNAGGILRGLLVHGDPARNGGIVPAQETDHVIAATVSNWGGYGLAAALAAYLDRPDILHDEAAERRMLLSASMDGLIDGVTGSTLPTSDGFAEEVHLAIVTLLRAIVGIGVPRNDWPGASK